MMRWILPKRNTTSRRTAPLRRTKFEGANGVPNESGSRKQPSVEQS
jgi:hypothetical protein